MAGAVDLGLTREEFCDVTPRFVSALRRQHELMLERSESQMAILLASYSNVHRDRDARPQPFDVHDFMPGRRRKPRSSAPRVQTKEEHLGVLRQFTAAARGRRRQAPPNG